MSQPTSHNGGSNGLIAADDQIVLNALLRTHRAGMALIGQLLTGWLDDPTGVLVSIERVVGGIEDFERNIRSGVTPTDAKPAA
jgi:hypothetical protein